MQVGNRIVKSRSAEDIRLDTWLWLYLRRENHQNPIGDFDQFDFRANMMNHFGYQKILPLVEVLPKQYILSQQILKWITKDERQINWILSYIRVNLKCEIYSCPVGLLGRERVIASLDLWDSRLDHKNSAVDEMRLAWNEHVKGDVMFQWFTGVEELARCASAWEWLVENGKTNAYGVARITNHKELLMFFDAPEISSAQKELDVKRIKVRWNQRKNKENNAGKGKGQCNVNISIQTIANLNNLMMRHGLSKSEIVERLIQSEFEKGNYLLEN